MAGRGGFVRSARALEDERDEKRVHDAAVAMIL